MEQGNMRKTMRKESEVRQITRLPCNIADQGRRESRAHPWGDEKNFKSEILFVYNMHMCMNYFY